MIVAGVVLVLSGVTADAAKLKQVGQSRTYTENGVEVEPPESAITPPTAGAAAAATIEQLSPPGSPYGEATSDKVSIDYLIEGDAGEEPGSCVAMNYTWVGQWSSSGTPNFAVDVAVGGNGASASSYVNAGTETASASTSGGARIVLDPNGSPSLLWEGPKYGVKLDGQANGDEEESGWVYAEVGDEIRTNVAAAAAAGTRGDGTYSAAYRNVLLLELYACSDPRAEIVPTLGTWGRMALAGVLAALSLLVLRYRRNLMPG